jgi:hypothetical protein
VDVDNNFGFKTRKEDNERRREEWQSRARRGDDPPSVPAGLRGKASAEEVERWTTYKPAKPPGRT